MYAAPRVWLLVLLSAVGVGVSTYLTKVALDPAKEIVCGPLGDCHTVQSSQYADVAGVPVAVLGLGMYVALLVFSLARVFRAGPPVLLEALPTLTFALALGGALYSLYLTYLELFVIDAVCAWCVTSAVLVTFVLGLTLPDVARGGGRSAGGTL